MCIPPKKEMAARPPAAVAAVVPEEPADPKAMAEVVN
jgi:hypothetical protein